jgi:hypothetical protein
MAICQTKTARRVIGKRPCLGRVLAVPAPRAGLRSQYRTLNLPVVGLVFSLRQGLGGLLISGHEARQHRHVEALYFQSEINIRQDAFSGADGRFHFSQIHAFHLLGISENKIFVHRV